MRPALHLELLSVPRLLLPGVIKPNVPGRRDAALLAWLALRGPTPRTRLVNLLWPALSVGRILRFLVACIPGV